MKVKGVLVMILCFLKTSIFFKSDSPVRGFMSWFTFEVSPTVERHTTFLHRTRPCLRSYVPYISCVFAHRDRREREERRASAVPTEYGRRGGRRGGDAHDEEVLGRGLHGATRLPPAEDHHPQTQQVRRGHERSRVCYLRSHLEKHWLSSLIL